MLIIPAIDIRHGRCVRLLQGDPDRETVYSDDPLGIARGFQRDGARLIHIVDLDGAFEGKPVNRELIAKIASAVDIPVEIGGGIRDKETITYYLNAGISRIIVGTVLLDPASEGMIATFKENIIAGIDARDSRVSTHGWKTTSDAMAIDLIKDLSAKGIDEFIYTDISTDGMLTGPNVNAIRSILDCVPGIKIVASGGVSKKDDLRSLADLKSPGLVGCIVGKAIYDGRLSLKESVREFQENNNDIQKEKIG